MITKSATQTEYDKRPCYGKCPGTCSECCFSVCCSGVWCVCGFFGGIYYGCSWVCSLIFCCKTEK